MTSFLRHAASHLAFTVAEVGQWVCIYRNEWRTTEEWIVLTSFPDSWRRNNQKWGSCGVATHTTNAPRACVKWLLCCCLLLCGLWDWLPPRLSEDHENRCRNIQNVKYRICHGFETAFSNTLVAIKQKLIKFRRFLSQILHLCKWFRFRTVSDSFTHHIFLSCVNRIWLWNLLLFVHRERIEPMTFSSSVS